MLDSIQLKTEHHEEHEEHEGLLTNKGNFHHEGHEEHEGGLTNKGNFHHEGHEEHEGGLTNKGNFYHEGHEEHEERIRRALKKQKLFTMKGFLTNKATLTILLIRQFLPRRTRRARREDTKGFKKAKTVHHEGGLTNKATFTTKDTKSTKRGYEGGSYKQRQLLPRRTRRARRGVLQTKATFTILLIRQKLLTTKDTKSTKGVLLIRQKLFTTKSTKGFLLIKAIFTTKDTKGTKGGLTNKGKIGRAHV